MGYIAAVAAAVVVVDSAVVVVVVVVFVNPDEQLRKRSHLISIKRNESG